MQLKFYLNKFLKVDNIEHYTLKELKKLEEIYEDFKEKTDGVDPDFPSINFKSKGTKLKVGSSVYSLMDAKPDSEGVRKKVDISKNNSDSDKLNTRSSSSSSGIVAKMPPNIKRK